MKQNGIEGTLTFTPEIHLDNRGNFHEWFEFDVVSQKADIDFRLAQANCSVSKQGVIRGIHFTDVPPGQAKYVICASGQILDILVDVRVGSPTFGSWDAIQLDDVNRHAVFISEGIGHAFMAVSPQATVIYLCSTPYTPESERTINPLDPDLGIEWPNHLRPVLSAKDKMAPSLNEAMRAGILPAYDCCKAFYTQR